MIALQMLGRFAEWEEAAEIATRRWPGHYRFKMHAAFAKLKTGRFAEGMRIFTEAMPARTDLDGCVLFNAPVWKPGDAPGPVLLWNPDGFGDGLHLVRYAALAARDGADITMVANTPEERLMARIAGINRTVRTDAIDEVQRWLTVFHLAATYLPEIPAAPYLAADPMDVARWAGRLRAICGGSASTGSGAPLFASPGAHFAASTPPNPPLARGGGLRVGVAWRGNPKQEMDRRRSFDVKQLEPLFGLEDVTLVSLQKGHREDLAGTPIVDLGDEYQDGDWLETAAVVQNLDLVITPCSGIAHLAGALGAPVWMALAEPGCWRWLTEREDSVWYPSMRIFRQPSRGNWPPVFERMARELAAAVDRGYAALSIFHQVA